MMQNPMDHLVEKTACKFFENPASTFKQFIKILKINFFSFTKLSLKMLTHIIQKKKGN